MFDKMRKVLKWVMVLFENNNIHCLLGSQGFDYNKSNYGFYKLVNHQLIITNPRSGLIIPKHYITKFNHNANKFFNLAPTP